MRRVVRFAAERLMSDQRRRKSPSTPVADGLEAMLLLKSLVERAPGDDE